MVTWNPPASGYTPCQTWTNAWIHLENSSTANEVIGIISNTLPGIDYILLCKSNLIDAIWTPVQVLTATSSITPFTVATSDANSLFFWAVLATNSAAPVILSPPSNQVVAAGGSATFSVTAQGYPAVGYQWMHDGTNLPGATASTLTIPSVNSNNVGSYTVMVTNVLCEASATAGLGMTWSINLGAPIDASPAVDASGNTFIATTGSMLFALDAAGNIKWSTNITTGNDNDITSSAALAADGSAVYVGSQDSGGYLEAFNPTNGVLLWQTNLGSEVSSTPAISGGGTIYVTTMNGSSNGLFSINPASHAVNWFFQTDDPNNSGTGTDSSPAVGPNCNIYFIANDDLFAVNPNGQLAWFFPIPGQSTPSPSPAIDGSGNILIGSSDGYVYCIAPSGGLQWIFDTGTGSPIKSSIALGPNGVVVCARSDGVVFGITNGVAAWQFTTSTFGFVSSPAISQDNEVVIGCLDDSVYGLTQGGVQWTYATGSYILSSPAISPVSGAVIIGSEDGFVYSLAGVSGLATNGPWPMFHANPSHTGATPNPTCAGGSTLVAFPNNPLIQTNTSPSTFSFNASGTPGSGWVPQLAGSNGYYAVTNSQGTNWVFTTTRSGYLWFGFNDDSIKEVIGDNYGSVAGQIIITNEP
jgi:hypothetical protein